jgi:LacI family transcriptional regulator
VSTGADRLSGYREALLEAGVPYEDRWVVDAGFREERAYDAACAMLSAQERPTAIFAANNLIAIGVMRAIADSRLRCPEDVSVVSIDDFAWANAFRPRLTTVAQPVAAMGESAVRLLTQRIAGEGPETTQLEVMAPMLVVRDSCSRPVGTPALA